MPCAPLLTVEETEISNVELILEQAEVSVSMLFVSVSALEFKQQFVVDLPVPL